MAYKELPTKGYRVTVQRSLRYPPSVSIRKWYRAAGAEDDDDLRAGLPGMELTARQFHQLCELKSELEQLGRDGKNAQCMLGGNRLVEVRSGGNNKMIILRRLPLVLGAFIPARHELTFKPRLWKEFWCHHEWILKQLEEAALEGQRIPDDDDDEGEEEEFELEKKRKKLDNPQLDAKKARIDAEEENF